MWQVVVQAVISEDDFLEPDDTNVPHVDTAMFDVTTVASSEA